MPFSGISRRCHRSSPKGEEKTHIERSLIVVKNERHQAHHMGTVIQFDQMNTNWRSQFNSTRKEPKLEENQIFQYFWLLAENV